MGDHIALYRQAKAARRRAEQTGFPNTAAALARIADLMAQEANVDREVVVPFAPRAAAPATVALPICRQVRR